MSRKCTTCQHVKRAEIDRRLASGEPGKQVALDYGLNPSSVHRHRANCLKLASSNAIMKEIARGTAAAACLPSKNDLGSAYADLQARLDHIVRTAEQDGQSRVAIAGLASMRQTLDRLVHLGGHDRPAAEADGAVNNDIGFDPAALAERLIQKFDHEPELKAKIAAALFALDDDKHATAEPCPDKNATETDDESS